MTRSKDATPEALPELPAQDHLRFGRRLVRRRGALGWSQRELSRRTSLPSSRLSRLERGKAKPRLDELLRLRAVLGGTLDELVFEPASPSAEGIGQVLRDLERCATAEDVALLCKLVHLIALGLRCAPGGVGGMHVD